MAKRKLTQQQQQRIKDNQKKRTKGKKDADIDLSNYTSEQKGLVTGYYGHQVEVEVLEGENQGQIVLCKKRANLPPLITGDHVIWCQGDSDGVIVACEERSSLLQRPDMRGKMRPVAANIDQVFIVFCASPPTPINLIDRYLVAAHCSELLPILILNKADLVVSDSEYDLIKQEYQALGYQCLTYSCEEKTGIEALNNKLADKKSIFVGQSGVGKSSILQTLLPDLDIRIGAISDATGKGKHTTTNANLFHLPNGGDLIDSPGIREFGLWHVEKKDIIHYFPEFSELARSCKFRDCKHQTEPGCAIQSALEATPALQRRFDSMKSIEASVEEVDVRF